LILTLYVDPLKEIYTILDVVSLLLAILASVLVHKFLLLDKSLTDEFMIHQISSIRDPHLTCSNSWNEDGHSKESSIIQFGDLHILSNDTSYPWCKKIFIGANMNEKKKHESTPYIMVGSMRVLL
jgi:hypothetical protein